ncbi:hypothetical protein [Levilactobacillus acidifarinae]|uniref:Uncharacterized protein n=1 Tax=Levilactobacillus acidifarinae DSM 19394 = JCM 15949 TaxID=1423715 RepID=A0A0R1LL80_9LACO|nr:hypothetical protein [Levilactobacillus acidifarinae]KRK96559.1 hypothetical protein FD25_GL002056 [Levilactobacillus acidifarinae DSM 19394]GEO70475.1 hypothetical protein LAC03_23850 [Levilactobacillus acidifarinae]
MKLSTDQINKLISEAVSASVDKIDTNSEIQTVQDYFDRTRGLQLTWEKEYMDKTLTKIHQDSVNASLTAVISLLKELGLIEIED